MNGTEQRERGNAVAVVQKQIDDLGIVVDAMDTRVTAVARVTLDCINDDRAEQQAERRELSDRLTTGLAGAEMRLAALEHDDLAHERVIAPLRRLQAATFPDRLRWLLTGRI